MLPPVGQAPVKVVVLATRAILPLVALMAMAPVSTQKRLISTYYDTPDAALKERGLTLRVRDQGGNFIQTVKAGGPAAEDLLTRGEGGGVRR